MGTPAKSTTAVLTQLRKLMRENKPPLDAYIVPSCDAHNSEYIGLNFYEIGTYFQNNNSILFFIISAPRDERRSYISGFDGSAGTAIVTSSGAFMWTDGRYFLQAGTQMDENWTLMKEGQPGN